MRFGFGFFVRAEKLIFCSCLERPKMTKCKCCSVALTSKNRNDNWERSSGAPVRYCEKCIPNPEYEGYLSPEECCLERATKKLSQYWKFIHENKKVMKQYREWKKD
jgi:hypothetical protein